MFCPSVPLVHWKRWLWRYCAKVSSENSLLADAIGIEVLCFQSNKLSRKLCAGSFSYHYPIRKT